MMYNSLGVLVECMYSNCQKNIIGYLFHGMNLNSLELFFSKHKLIRYSDFDKFIHRECLLSMESVKNEKVWCSKCLFPDHMCIKYDALIDYLNIRLLDPMSYLIPIGGWIQLCNGIWYCGKHKYEFNIFVCDNKNCNYGVSYIDYHSCSDKCCKFMVCSNCLCCACGKLLE